MHRVGLIGLGKMGLPIARNLMERGFEVTGYRRSGSPELAAAGGTVAGSAAEVAAAADVLLSIVPDAAAVEEVICGPAGTLTALRPGTVHIEMSTIDIGHKTRLRDAVRARGGDLLDCPISGSPGMVAPRRATTFASGDRASVDRVAPVLDAVSGPWVYTGEFGTGARMKYIANLLLAVHTVAAAEAIALARSPDANVVARRGATIPGLPLMGQSSRSPPRARTASRSRVLCPMSMVLISMCTVPGRSAVSVPAGPAMTSSTASASGTMESRTSAAAATSAGDPARVPPAAASSGEPLRR